MPEWLEVTGRALAVLIGVPCVLFGGAAFVGALAALVLSGNISRAEERAAQAGFLTVGDDDRPEPEPVEPGMALGPHGRWMHTSMALAEAREALNSGPGREEESVLLAAVESPEYAERLQADEIKALERIA